MHHPWREFSRLTDWTLRWEELPDGVWGLTDFTAQTVTLTLGLSQAERRCTIAHETQHILRGPVPEQLVDVEEIEVDRNVARLLLPDLRAIGDVLAAAHDVEAAAADLWVDGIILETRLRALHPAERGWLRERLALLSA